MYHKTAASKDIKRKKGLRRKGGASAATTSRRTPKILMEKSPVLSPSSLCSYYEDEHDQIINRLDKQKNCKIDEDGADRDDQNVEIGLPAASSSPASCSSSATTAPSSSLLVYNFDGCQESPLPQLQLASPSPESFKSVAALPTLFDDQISLSEELVESHNNRMQKRSRAASDRSCYCFCGCSSSSVGKVTGPSSFPSHYRQQFYTSSFLETRAIAVGTMWGDEKPTTSNTTQEDPRTSVRRVCCYCQKMCSISTTSTYINTALDTTSTRSDRKKKRTKEKDHENNNRRTDDVTTRKTPASILLVKKDLCASPSRRPQHHERQYKQLDGAPENSSFDTILIAHSTSDDTKISSCALGGEDGTTRSTPIVPIVTTTSRPSCYSVRFSNVTIIKYDQEQDDKNHKQQQDQIQDESPEDIIPGTTAGLLRVLDQHGDEDDANIMKNDVTSDREKSQDVPARGNTTSYSFPRSPARLITR